MAKANVSVPTTANVFRIVNASVSQSASIPRGPVQDHEILVRTIFRRQATDRDGRLKPTYFRPEPTGRGFSV